MRSLRFILPLLLLTLPFWTVACTGAESGLPGTGNGQENDIELAGKAQALEKVSQGTSIDDSDVEDVDGDGVADDVDNCPTVPNNDQADDAQDGVGNACRHLAASAD
jgi:hypothetical protein